MYNVKDLKPLFDLNQNLKLIYSKWSIINNYIIGTPVLDAEGNCKEKFKKSFYKTDILSKLPELNYFMFNSVNIYEVYKNRKNFLISKLESGLLNIQLTDNEITIGKNLMEENDIDEVLKSLQILSEEFSLLMDNKDEIYEVDELMINELIEYKMIRPCLYNNRNYSMYLTISEFPLLKKLKKIKIYSSHKFETDEWFDVIYETYDKSDSFFMKRRFIKI